jgi:predicted PurR-regulated permease PerM
MKINFINATLLVFVIIFFIIMAPFWKAAVWGITLAIVFYPLHRKLSNYIKGPNLSAFITILVIFITIALPITIAVFITVNETEKFINNIDLIKASFQSVIDKFHQISKLKLLAPWLDKIDDSLFSLLKNTGVLITKNVGVLFSQTYNIVANFVFSFIITFYLIKDKDRFINYMAKIVNDRESLERIIKSVELSINATVLGGVATAFIQGIVGAVGFFIVGLNAFFMWMFLIALFSFVPLVGTAIIWIPAAAYLFISGNYFGGIFMLIWGIGAIGMVDNYVRPLIIGSKINIHPMFLFFGIIGAIVVFGPIGIIVGPVSLSVVDALVRVYIEHNARTL